MFGLMERVGLFGSNLESEEISDSKGGMAHMMLTSTQIVPCPFCGHTVMKIADYLKELDTGRTVYWVECCRCGGSGPSTYKADVAIKLWNGQVDKRALGIYKTVVDHLRYHNGEYAAGRIDGNKLSVAIMGELALLMNPSISVVEEGASK